MKNKFFLTAILTALVFPAIVGKTILKESESTARSQLIMSNLTPAIQAARVHEVAISTFPYIQNFDVNDITSEGWLISDPAITVLTSGSFNMQTGTLSGLAALSGKNYLISGFDMYASRNAWAFSPTFTLSGGVTYHIYINAYAKGYSGVKDEFKVTVGTNQTSSSQSTVIIDKTGANAVNISAWTRYEGTFTPATTGTYNFGINHCTIALDVNATAFENFVVSNSVFVEPPTVDIYNTGGLQSATKTNNNSIYLSATEPLNYIVKVANTSSFLWEFDASATPSSTIDSTAVVTYSSDGTHKATLNATGSGGKSIGTVSHYLIRPIDNVTSDIVYNFKSYDLSTTSYFTENNYVVGPNTYYKKVAEKYTLPTNTSVSISQIYLNLGAYNITSANQLKNISISILKADDAGDLPGSVVNTITTTYASLLGTSVISSSTTKIYTYSTPVTVTGSFYIVVDFATIASTNSTNYIGIVTTTPRKYKDASLYVYYNNAWVSSGSLIPNGQLSAYIAPKITFIPSLTTSFESCKLSQINIFISDNKLNIQHAQAGNSLKIYNSAGVNIYSSIVQTENTVLPISLKKGMYIVKVADKATKIISK